MRYYLLTETLTKSPILIPSVILEILGQNFRKDERQNKGKCLDALIDKIVYRLYGLTDEEIELIERPQYEQALTDAKAQVVADKTIKDDEEKIEKIADSILPAAKRFFERIEPSSVEEL